MFKRTKKNKRAIVRKNSRKYKNNKKRFGGANNAVSICIYSHSSVFDVLQVEVDYLTKLFKGTEQKIYFFLDKEYTINNELKYITVLYDDNMAYTKRISYCLDKVDTAYCIISHESDVLVKYNKNAIEILANTMAEKNIDSVDLVVRDPSCKKEVKITDTLYIMNLKGSLWHRNTDLLFTVQPRLWNRMSAIKMFSSVGDFAYKNSENPRVQEYINSNQSVYGVCSIPPVVSFGLLGEPFLSTNDYVSIHILQGGKFVRKAVEANAINSNIASIEKEIYDKYIQPSTGREKSTGSGHRAYAVNGFPGLFKKVYSGAT